MSGVIFFLFPAKKSKKISCFLLPVSLTAAETQFQREIRCSEKTMEGGENLTVLAGARAYSSVCREARNFAVILIFIPFATHKKTSLTE